MFKKIILPFVLLIFTQQNFYGMKESNENKKEIDHKQNEVFWIEIDSYCNSEHDGSKSKRYPRLWWLWAFLDNVQFQYGNSKKIWKHGEAYYGLSNGIGFFPSPLNFGWLKIGIVDVHINVINIILVGFKHLIKQKERHADYYSVWYGILYALYYNSVMTGIHLFSFNFINCIKVKIISIGAIILKLMEEIDSYGTYWYHVCSSGCYNLNNYGLLSSSYLLLSPRIEINIPGIINYFRGQ